MRRKTWLDNRVLFALSILILIATSLFGLYSTKVYIGKVGYEMNATAGYIYELAISVMEDANLWTGLYGDVLRTPSNPQMNFNFTTYGGMVAEYDMNPNCVGVTGYDMYASTVPLEQIVANPATTQAVTTSEIIAFMGINDSVLQRESPIDFYSSTYRVNYGGTNITTIAGYTNQAGVPGTQFVNFVLKDSAGHYLFGFDVQYGYVGYDSTVHNFQLMLPMPANQTNYTWYFFPDPVSDPLVDCPLTARAPIVGWVKDITTDEVLVGAKVNVTGVGNQTSNARGYYEFERLITDSQYVFTTSKAGYKGKTDIMYHSFGTIINTTGNVTLNGTVYNISLLPDFVGINLNASVRGTVRNNITGDPIEDVIVAGGGGSDYTSDTGNYSFAVRGEPNLLFIAYRQGYVTNVFNLSFAVYERKIYDLNMTPAGALADTNATVYGTVTDADTGALIENVTVAVGPFAALSNANGTYNMSIVGDEYRYLVGIKDGYDPYVGSLLRNISTNNGTNYTVFYGVRGGEALNHNISLSVAAEVVPGLGPGMGPGLGPGQGPGTGVQEVIEVKTKENEAPAQINVYVSIDQIRKRVKQDSFVEESLSIYNFGSQVLSIDLAIEGDVAPLIQLDKTRVDLLSNSSHSINLKMFGLLEPNTYYGQLVIKGDFKAVIPIELTIVKESKIPVHSLIVKIDALKNTIIRGTDFRYKVDLINLLTDKNYEVNMNFTLINAVTGDSIPMGMQNATVQTFRSILRKGTTDQDLPLGDYVLSVEAQYLGESSTANTLVTIADPFYKYNLFGILPIWLLSMILSLFVSGFFLFIIIRRNMEKKKRFHAKIDYGQMPQKGDRTLCVGHFAETNRNSYFDMDVLTVHTIVAGSTGGGKSVSAQDIVEEALLKGVAVVVFDPTAQWSGMLRKNTDKKFLALYPAFGMKVTDAKGFPGNIKPIKDGREIIDLNKYLKPGEIQVFTANTLDPKDYDLFVANTIREVFHSNLQEYRGLRYMLVYDEIHRILPKFGGSGEGFVQIERGCREFRKWGIGILLISQVLADFVGQIKANINTEIQMKTRDEGDLQRIKMKYGEEFIQSLVKAPVGSGMVQNSAWNRGQPFYVTFRPLLHSVIRLSDDELEQYNKYNKIVDQLEYELEQLDTEHHQDVFDLKLELKLSKDKIKSGAFNMVQIYLEGLTPRITKVWEKLAKKPKQLQVRLVDVTAMQAELQAAQASREKYEKEMNEAMAKNASAQAAAPPPAAAKVTDEEIKTMKDQIKELTQQTNDGLARGDKAAAKEMFDEIPKILKKIPPEKQGDLPAKVQALSDKVEGKTPPPAAAPAGAPPAGGAAPAGAPGAAPAQPQAAPAKAEAKT